MQQLIILQQAALDSFLASTTPDQSALLLLCPPNELEDETLRALERSSAEIYWLLPSTEDTPFGEHANYDKWAELSVQYDRSFFWPV